MKTCAKPWAFLTVFKIYSNKIELTGSLSDFQMGIHWKEQRNLKSFSPLCSASSPALQPTNPLHLSIPMYKGQRAVAMGKVRLGSSHQNNNLAHSQMSFAGWCWALQFLRNNSSRRDDLAFYPYRELIQIIIFSNASCCNSFSSLPIQS